MVGDGVCAQEEHPEVSCSAALCSVSILSLIVSRSPMDPMVPEEDRSTT